jgi:hypothetical protein
LNKLDHLEEDGLAASGFTLVETGADTGVFTGDFQVPAEYCARSSGTGTVTSVMGTDIEVNYVDYRDVLPHLKGIWDDEGWENRWWPQNAAPNKPSKKNKAA